MLNPLNLRRVSALYTLTATTPDGEEVPSAMVEVVLTVTADDAATIMALPADLTRGCRVYEHTSGRLWFVACTDDNRLIAAVVAANPSPEGEGV